MLAAVAVGLAGCQQQVDKKLTEGIGKGLQAYYQRNLVSAEQLLTSAIAVDPHSPAAAEGYYVRGLVRNDRGEVRLAEMDFFVAMELSKREDLKTNCQISLGSIAYNNGDYRHAYEYYLKASDHLPKMAPNESVLYRLGVCCQNIGQWEEAKKHFARVRRDFPYTQAVGWAEKRMKYNFFTVQAGVFSRAEGARRAMAGLQNAALPATAITRRDGDVTHQIIYVGKYNDYASAAKILERVKKIVPDARIVP